MLEYWNSGILEHQTVRTSLYPIQPIQPIRPLQTLQALQTLWTIPYFEFIQAVTLSEVGFSLEKITSISFPFSSIRYF